MRALSRRYARALLAVSSSPEAGRHLQQQLNLFAALLKNKQIADVFRNNAIPLALKQTILKEFLVQAQYESVLSNFMQVLLEKGRIHLFSEVLEEYAHLLDQGAGIEVATVTLSTSPTPETQREVEAALASVLHPKVRFIFLHKPEILGGFVVQMGQRILDLSLQRKLRDTVNLSVLGKA